MEKFIKVLKKVHLFEGISEEELKILLPCLGSDNKNFKKNEIITLDGEEIKDVGIILEGKIVILKEDINGNRNILAHLGEADLFAEVFACAGINISPVTVMADSKAEVMFIDFNRIISSCNSACGFHSRLIENMLKLMARKNLALNEKVNCLGHRTTKEKVMTFLSVWMERAGKNPFEIPFSRVQMADYLCVDRSALSAVLCEMRDEGQIKFEKNRFEIL